MTISRNFHGGGCCVARKGNLHKAPTLERGRIKWPS